MRGSCLSHAQISLQYLKFSLRYTMGNMSGMFLFAFWVIRALKCVAVVFPKFESAGIPVRPFRYLDTSILIVARAPCLRARDAHAQRDMTRFASCVNHITMMSPAFTFHSCHVVLRWHDVISIRIVGTPRHYGSHGDDIDMTSPCSHCIRIALVTSSWSDRDVIATRVNHDCSRGA